MSSSWVAVGRPHKSHHSSQRHPLIREQGILLKGRSVLHAQHVLQEWFCRGGVDVDVESQVVVDGVSWFFVLYWSPILEHVVSHLRLLLCFYLCCKYYTFALLTLKVPIKK